MDIQAVLSCRAGLAERIDDGQSLQLLTVLEVLGVKRDACGPDRAGSDGCVVDRKATALRAPPLAKPSCFASATARSWVRALNGSTRQTCRNAANDTSTSSQGVASLRRATATNSLSICTLIVPPSARRFSARLALAASPASRPSGTLVSKNAPPVNLGHRWLSADQTLSQQETARNTRANGPVPRDCSAYG